jgi:2-C-methyl-D-erythritol 4-phosphate cytidylyltransferase
MQKTHVIIVAGGSGSRMGAEIPKQFLHFAGKPILLHTIEKFYATNAAYNLILVLPESHFGAWEEIIQQFNCTIPHQLVKGGNTRFHSVKNGLALVNDGFVAVHDAVRPLVTSNTIKNTLEAAFIHGAAIPVIESTDSVRILSDNGSVPLTRSLLRNVQTPQCFDTSILKQAMQQEFNQEFTDCASVVQKAGFPIFLSEGNIENIKITTPLDLKIAECIRTEFD